MAIDCKFIIFFSLLMVAVCLASSVVDSDGATIRQSRQFLAGHSPLPYYAGFPVPISAPGIPLFNKPNHRQINGIAGGPTYVGVFPVLTGQQACPPTPTCPNATVCPDTPACPVAPECKNCTVCQTCPDIPAAPGPEDIEGCFQDNNPKLSSSPNGTITFTYQRPLPSPQPCYYGIMTSAPYTAIDFKCDAADTDGFPKFILNGVMSTQYSDGKTVTTPGNKLFAVVTVAKTSKCSWEAKKTT